VTALATVAARRATYRATARRSRAAGPWGLASNATKRVISPGIVPTEEDFPVVAEEMGEASATIATTSAILPANVPRDPAATAAVEVEVAEAGGSEGVAHRNATSAKVLVTLLASVRAAGATSAIGAAGSGTLRATVLNRIPASATSAIGAGKVGIWRATVLNRIPASVGALRGRAIGAASRATSPRIARTTTIESDVAERLKLLIRLKLPAERLKLPESPIKGASRRRARVLRDMT